jgi:acetylornithine/N-succinyldiaminopimelate aminotransferase
LLDNVQERGAQLRQGLEAIAKSYPAMVAEVRGWGLINGIELQSGLSVTSIDLVKAAMEKKLLLVPAGPSVVRFVPPLIVSAAEVDEALYILEQVFRDEAA